MFYLKQSVLWVKHNTCANLSAPAANWRSCPFLCVSEPECPAQPLVAPRLPHSGSISRWNEDRRMRSEYRWNALTCLLHTGVPVVEPAARRGAARRGDGFIKDWEPSENGTINIDSRGGYEKRSTVRELDRVSRRLIDQYQKLRGALGETKLQQ